MSTPDMMVDKNENPLRRHEEEPFFSVILPTRNRPALFREALESVLSQTYRELEVIVVNDGSADEFLAEYRAMETECDARVRWHYQPQRPNGHGQSYSMNSGAYMARGDYICFLDDDDTWCDSGHLQRAYETLACLTPRADVLYSNQTAFTSQGEPIPQKLWIADLEEKLNPDLLINDDTYQVTASFMLSSAGFAHLNCTIIRRALYLEMTGMDENVRYECDLDIYLRTIDRAERILYSPLHIAAHNVPDPSRKDNMSTLVSDLEKRLYQINVFEKVILFARRENVRRHASRRLSIIYKHMSKSLLRSGRVRAASKHANQALALHYSMKWNAYCIYLALRGVFSS